VAFGLPGLLFIFVRRRSIIDIWLPGLGNVPFHVMEAGNAVNDYDPDLMLGRNNKTGEWSVLVKNGPHGGEPFPVFNLGRELPSYTEIQKRLYDNDVRKHGHRIVEQIQRRVDARKKQLDAAGTEVSAETAEVIDHGMRKLGMLPNTQRIFVPSGKG
jgi:hypothetical protein